MPYVHWALVTLVVALPLVPLLRYLAVGRRMRSREVLGAFSPRAVQFYFERFWTGDESLKRLAAEARDALGTAEEARYDAELLRRFRALYDRQFGGHTFVPPLALLTLILGVEASVVFQSVLPFAELRGDLYMPIPGVSLDAVAIASLGGAYMWVVGDVILRLRRRDCLPSDIYWHCSRLVIAVPLGYAIAQAAGESGAVVAFALGAFPMEAITRILRRIVNRALRTDESPEEVTELVKLTCVDNTIASRLQSEGITNVQTLVSTDPVLLCVRANMPFDLVMECMNEAIAWRYFKDQLALLRPAGLRGAYEMKDFVDALHWDPNDPAVAPAPGIARSAWQEDMAAIKVKNEALLPILAQKLKVSELELLTGLEHVAGESYTRFIYRVWE